jgi:hypothetical protein
MGLVTVYKIPPLKVNEGHRANDWGDLANPLWKGRLRIIEKTSETALVFEDSATGVCPFHNSTPSQALNERKANVRLDPKDG